jgi:outer membrane immunogenic protein
LEVAMKALLTLASALLGVAVCGTAFAADLPTRKAPAAPYAPPQPAFTWGGLYVGAFAGGNWASVTTRDLTVPGFTGEPKLNSNGLTAGGLAGYNWAFNQFVLGGEVEAGYDRRGVTANYTSAAGVPLTQADLGSAEGRVRGRIGYAWGNFLLFAAGGATAQDLKLTVSNLNTGYSQEITHWRGGFNVGGGLEWAFNDHWILRGEYIYDRFSRRSYDFLALDPANGFNSRSALLEESTARAALEYKF